jgi:hypothetical protein
MKTARPYFIGQKVTVHSLANGVDQVDTAHVTLTHQLDTGMGEVTTVTGDGRALSFRVPANGHHDRLAPAAPVTR